MTENKTKHDTIKALDDRQKSRDKLAIWYGSVENYYHGIKEVIANSTDEIINNFKNGVVSVELFDDLQTVKIIDTGRGMHIDGETDGVKNYDLLFRTLFAGTKYDEGDSTTTGTNGVGNTVLCYTSSFFKVESYYDGFKHSLEFSNGGIITQDLKKEKTTKNAHGTSITFRLDNEIYPNITYDPKELRDIVKRFAVGSSKVKLTFKHLDEQEEFHYESVEDYFNEMVGNQSTSPIVSAPNTIFTDEDEKTELELTFTTSAEPIQESYLNLTYLPEMGSFHDGIITGVKVFANKFCKENNLFPKNVKTFLTSDIETSISYVCVALSNNVQFQSQTKFSTNKSLYKKVARAHVLQLLEILAIENPKGLKKFMDHILTVQKHNASTQKAMKKLKAQLNEKIDSISNKVGDLVDCKFHDDNSELYIAEGKSALGSLVFAREAKFQAIYPLRGKILNCLKASFPTILNNQVITDLIKVLGCGIQADKKNKDIDGFNIKNLRFGKVIIATDADTDGFQIACLIITMFYRLMPQLLTDGYIYIAQTPLYEIKLENDEMIYYYSEQEKEEKLPLLTGKYMIARCKGLGELSPEVMSETAMNVQTRNLIRVNVEDAQAMADTLELWMDTEVEGRKDYISKNLNLYLDDLN